VHFVTKAANHAMLKASKQVQPAPNHNIGQGVEGAALDNPGWLAIRVFWQIWTNSGMKP
jgi:hypothetical protein